MTKKLTKSEQKSVDLAEKIATVVAGEKVGIVVRALDLVRMALVRLAVDDAIVEIKEDAEKH